METGCSKSMECKSWKTLCNILACFSLFHAFESWISFAYHNPSNSNYSNTVSKCRWIRNFATTSPGLQIELVILQDNIQDNIHVHEKLDPLGEGMQMQTRTTSNIKNFKQGIPVEAFPKPIWSDSLLLYSLGFDVTPAQNHSYNAEDLEHR